MNKILSALLAAAIPAFPGAISASPPAPALSLRSPSGALEVSLDLERRDGKEGIPVYRVSYKGRELVAASRLGLDLAGSGPLKSGLSAAVLYTKESDSVSPVLFGKRGEARDHYREAAVSLSEKGPGGRVLNIIFRAYDDGIAFRYLIPEQEHISSFGIKEELTEFAFSGNPETYYLPQDFGSHYEAYYRKDRLKKAPAGVQIGLPMLLKHGKGPYLAVTEAALTDYAGLYLAGAGGGVFRSRLAPSTLDTEAKVRGEPPFFSPWRVIMITPGPEGLLESDLIYVLNPPSALEDTSWIRPGKVVFGWWNGYHMPEARTFVPGVNTPTILRYIDFAAENGIPFVSLDGTNDEAWYGGPIGYAGQDVTKANPNL
ncbi:MAG TPA: glycoside hydrolase family 97 N-terminal domain-containing protein, partial [Elusimicrobiales bacterium]|nr:glycoside hydrolase family 97 N-terminal domain-containing protein [Elusimicrobiales bacterium]